MTADDMLTLSKLLDEKLKPMAEKVDAHDRDIRAFKAVLGALIWLGGAILAVTAVVQGWVSHK
jgi:hypothetical protein